VPELMPVQPRKEWAYAMKPLDRATLPDRVAQEFLTSILDGPYHPGQPLPSEADIASAFVVSRAVVNEGVGHLKAMGVSK
jgi:DNA-binding FadR family transcriptional regulator